MLRLKCFIIVCGLVLTIGIANAKFQGTNYSFGSYGRGKHVYCSGYFMAQPTSSYKWCGIKPGSRK